MKMLIIIKFKNREKNYSNTIISTMDLDDLLEEFKDDHKNAKTGGTNGVGAVKGAKKAS